ncbi:CPBP family intramembrane metalloprotease [Leptolyngbya sp. FACHB-261]|nr:CPBP family intramembrane metalloprotease [Leptolyngbya sp. FACHB-261]
MGVTALVLLLVAKLWAFFVPVQMLPVRWEWSALLNGVLLGLLITAASAGVYRIWPGYRDSADYYLHLVLSPLLLPDMLWLGLLPGMSEELLFRGVMLAELGLTPAGLVVTSVCFGILHLSDPKQWPYVVWATIVGLGLGWSAILTHNLLVPIVAHVLTNWVSSLSWKLGRPAQA